PDESSSTSATPPPSSSATAGTSSATCTSLHRRRTFSSGYEVRCWSHDHAPRPFLALADTPVTRRRAVWALRPSHRAQGIGVLVLRQRRPDRIDGDGPDVGRLVQLRAARPDRRRRVARRERLTDLVAGNRRVADDVPLA